MSRSEDLTLSVIPIMDDKELFTSVRYLEGTVNVSVSHSGANVSGRGHVELTGYAN